MTTEFKSVFRSNINEYLNLKRSTGVKYERGVFMLTRFDKFAFERNCERPVLTEELAEEFCKGDSRFLRNDKLTYLAGFSSFANLLGEDSYVPLFHPSKKSNFIPYIFTSNEIKVLFQECDKIKLKKTREYSVLFSVPIIIRLLYATGLRIGEAVSLKNEDVDLKAGVLTIRSTKNGIDRTIPISNSLVESCEKYVSHRDSVIKKKCNFFFVKYDGQKCSHQGVRSWFKKILTKAKIKGTGARTTPRVHDLRHTFAVTAMFEMINRGLDLYAALPILSGYLGHLSYKATCGYLRLAEMHYPALTTKVNYWFDDIFPKIN